MGGLRAAESDTACNAVPESDLLKTGVAKAGGILGWDRDNLGVGK